jgi:hypothetical protein
VEAWEGILLTDWIATTGHNPDVQILYSRERFPPAVPAIGSKFPLFRSAYYYYWFYMFLI